MDRKSRVIPSVPGLRTFPTPSRTPDRYLRPIRLPLDGSSVVTVNGTSWTISLTASGYEVTYSGAGAVETIDTDASGLFLIFPDHPMTWAASGDTSPGLIGVHSELVSADTDGMACLVGFNSSPSSLSEWGGRRVERISSTNMDVYDCSSIQAPNLIDATEANANVLSVRGFADWGASGFSVWLTESLARSLHDRSFRGTGFSDFQGDTVYPMLGFSAPAGGGKFIVDFLEQLPYPYE